MEEQNLHTDYAPAARAAKSEIERLNQHIIKLPLLPSIMNAVPNSVMILNKERQIVYANQICLDFLGKDDLSQILGQRPGEALNCIQSKINLAGCGTTKFCQACGAVNAILESQRSNFDSQECRIIIEDTASALDLFVMSTSFKESGEDLTIFAISDISHEKRRRILERIFFHDILNLASGLHGVSNLLLSATKDELDQYKSVVSSQSNILVSEINAQIELLAAENHDLTVKTSPINTYIILKELKSLYENHKVAYGITLKINHQAEQLQIRSDPSLLRRILGNMIKNALEASKEGDTVTINCGQKNEMILFSVHNQYHIPSDIQIQIFQRSFSTKAKSRGLGTYSVKLLTEQYLRGKAYFESSERDGTTFYVLIPFELTA
ncbi:MAG: PAS domain-containing sensor histidine kinase [Deltaproteobacteria bacterium]|nr:PAS domain-containing sensor histidine kinase [Deltaproteobacteria bacterium]